MFGLIGALNLGEQLFSAVILVVVAWYILRGKSFLGTIIATVGMVTTIILGVLVVLAIAIGAGWLDPEPGVFITHLSWIWEAIVEFGRDIVVDWLPEGVL
jgi:hypothetical protein